MAEGKAPAFQFYASDDWFAHAVVQLMTHAQKGIYMDLKVHCWLHVTIPASAPELALLLKIPVRDVRSAWRVIGRAFAKAPTVSGRLIHPGIERKREELQSFKKQMSEGGKRGAEKRWGKGGEANAPPIDTPIASDGSSSSSSSSSSLRSSSPAPSTISPDQRERATRKRLLDMASEYKRAAQEAVMPGLEQEALFKGADLLRDMAFNPERRPAPSVFNEDITAYARGLGEYIACAERHGRGFRLTAPDEETP